MLAVVKPYLTNKAVFTVLFITAIVLSLLFITSNSAEAVQVRVSASSNNVSQGSSVTFTTTVSIQSTERIPIQTAKLTICADAACNSQLTNSPYLSPYNMTLSNTNPSTGYFTYGPGYGFDANLGVGYTFPEDDGYGGYSGVVTLTYQCTVTTSAQWAAGTYFARADIDCGSHTFSSIPATFTVTTSSGGGGGGGTGDSGASTEQPVETPSDTPTPSPISPIQVHTLSDDIDSEGVILGDVSVTFANGIVELQIPANTTALDQQGQPLAEITMEAPQAPALLPSEKHLVMVTDLGPTGATFDPPILVSMTYNPDSLPAGASEEDLVLAIHDSGSKQWISLEQISVDMVNHTVSGVTGHFTQFAILAEVEEPPTPAPTDTPTETSTPADIPAATETPAPTEDLTPTEAPVPTDTDESLDDDDDDGLNPWVIIGPVIGIVFIAFLVYLRKKQSKR
ncbi:MAG: hypothetical protein HQ553_07015 [Chloroflexi bacterium]|nr:hypothetical protein [Chloroflexota bacterium]